MNSASEPPRIAGPGAAAAQAASTPASGRMGYARPHLWARRQISLYARTWLHTARCASREVTWRCSIISASRAGVLVQGNAHGFDNSVLLDALARYPDRLRGVAITDTRIAPAVLYEWHKAGMRGLRFHLL